MPQRVVLAYSGGLDTSAIIPWLRENMDCEVIALVADVGQGDDELVGIEEKAMQTGASACYIADLKREYAEQYVFPTLTTGGVYEGRYLLGTATARPIIAKAQVDCARKVGADAVAHGCTGKGNDQVRFESAFAALAPDLDVIAPWRMWDLESREDLLNYLAERNIPCTASATKIYSRDRNLWHISHEGGAIENPWNAPPNDVWMLTVDPKDAPDQHEDITIDFVSGIPVAINGTEMAGDKLILALNKVGGRHGVGRVDIIENRRVGMKSRGLYETPGGTIILEALRSLEELVVDRESLRYREHLGLTFADLVYDGKWFSPLRESLLACAQRIVRDVTGRVVVRLYKGTATSVQRQSDFALYSEEFATFGASEFYDHKHAEGFIRLHSLPERIAAMRSQLHEASATR
ncbi:MAG: argininosuccinate synthase [Phycisphaeraceae bacterium]|nr:argininosuccinate synthase [Phycisphaerales bacterium]MCB9860730.1 argininosuccinate synthase [Phycisphaeraceae bacterium]